MPQRVGSKVTRTLPVQEWLALNDPVNLTQPRLDHGFPLWSAP